MSDQLNIIEWIQNWYVEQCNDSWEHSYGIKIDTIDNPGWIVTINLYETKLSGLEIEPIFREESEDDWISVKLENDTFIGHCGPRNLSELLKEFKKLAS